MTIGTFRVTKTVSNDFGPATKTFLSMARHTLEIRMHPFEGVIGQLRMVEGFDLERNGHMTCVALSLGRCEAELPSMYVGMTAGTFAWSSAVCCATTAGAVARRGLMTAVTRRAGMNPGQRPRAVIDFGRIPSARGMTARTASLGHFLGELVTMRVLVAIGALPALDPEVVPRPLATVAAAAGNCLVFPLQRKVRAAVLGYGEGSRPKALLIVAGRAVRRAEFASVRIAVAIGARGVL